MTPGIDPKVDYAFKKVFGSESNIDLLTLLLEAVLGFTVSAVQIINPFNEKETPDDKLSILDIKAKDALGRLFDVEMQMFPHEAIIPRLIYYWAKLYTGQLDAGEDFANLRPAASVIFPDTTPVRYRVWGPVQDQRVRYVRENRPFRFLPPPEARH